MKPVRNVTCWYSACDAGLADLPSSQPAAKSRPAVAIAAALANSSLRRGWAVASAAASFAVLPERPERCPRSNAMSLAE